MKNRFIHKKNKIVYNFITRSLWKTFEKKILKFQHKYIFYSKSEKKYPQNLFVKLIKKIFFENKKKLDIYKKILFAFRPTKNIEVSRNQ